MDTWYQHKTPQNVNFHVFTKNILKIHFRTLVQCLSDEINRFGTLAKSILCLTNLFYHVLETFKI